MNDRMKLAEAVGWTHWHDDRGDVWMPPGMTGNDHSGNAVRFNDLPDPENDANDDYAVLEWMRKSTREVCEYNVKYGANKPELFGDFMEALPACWGYKIGDYARAALKALP